MLERNAGCSVVGQAENGRDAVEVVRSQQPDVVLLDVAMPVMDGMEALPLIRTAAPRSRVILLTGFSNDEFQQRAMAGGAVAYLEKGTRPALLLDAVRAACAI